MNSTIRTYPTGQTFDLLSPDPKRIDIRDIAQSLAVTSRWVGHTHRAYSVAQHSVFVSQLVAPQYALRGLLHDAAEAYLGDASRPLKQAVPQLAALEVPILAAVFARFGLAPDDADADDAVKLADRQALAQEDRDLRPLSGMCGTATGPASRGVTSLVPSFGRLIPWPADYARKMFKVRFVELMLRSDFAGEVFDDFETILDERMPRSRSQATDWLEPL